MLPFGVAVSRRTILRAAAAAAASGVLRPASGQQRGPRVLALIGDRYHNADYIQVALTRMFDGLGLVVDYTIDYKQLSRKVLRDYQIFLCLRDGMIWPNGYLGPDAYTSYEQGLENRGDFPEAKSQSWLTEEQAVALKDFVTEGKGFYSLHNNSHVSLSSRTYREVMGGAYIGHPPLRPFQVHVVNSNHPITQGIHDFMVNDEQHYVEYDKDPKYVLLEAENIDGLTFRNLGAKSIAGWAYDYGRGRVVFTAVGHTIHALWAPEYLKLQRRAVQWLLKEI
ncbi:MAG TPA: ThuA domain-containing protein [Bryobacterales bacterium]|jgi:type 1 glutamine amidotransferase|nr:ThuA domain-containing protein [Bryobacterales bacterium]